MKVGSIGFTTHQGLGILLKDFVDNGVVTDVFTIQHPTYENHNWFSGPNQKDIPRNRFMLEVKHWVESMDLLLLFETSFFPQLQTWGTPAVLMPMHECTPTWESPTVWVAPSALDEEAFSGLSASCTALSVPIPHWVHWRLRERARVFVHNAGRGGLEGRNGTKTLLDAMPHVKSPIKLIIRSQKPIIQERFDSRINIRIGTVCREDLYREGDVFVFPERFNGLSLPLQEARASGMCILATDRFPMNTWLDKKYLVETCGSVERPPLLKYSRPFVEDKVSPITLSKKIDWLYDQNITETSKGGYLFGTTNSWTNLKPKYMELLGQVFLSSKLGATS